MRKYIVLLVFAFVAFTVIGAQAQPDSFFGGASGFDAGNHLNIDAGQFTNTDSGWFRDDGVHQGGNTNYLTGFCGPDDCGGFNYHGYWSFDLGGFDGNAASASFTVNSYLIQFDPGTLMLYGTSLTPDEVFSGNDYQSVELYNDLIMGPLIGSASFTPDDSFMYVTITFNSDGIAWLNSHAGMGAVIGADWNQGNGVPEPGTLLMLSTGALGVLGAIRRKLF